VKVAFASEFERAGEVPAPDLNSCYPLVLDLDGTLLRTDLLLEGILQYLKREPLGIFMLLIWACRGIAHLKQQVATRVDICIDLLPVNEPLLHYARASAERGRTVIAASAANREVAAKVCARFGFISGVLASCDKVNLTGARKAEALRIRVPGGYAYAGDAAADLHVWQEARLGIFAGRDQRLLDRVTRVTTLEADFSQPPATHRHWGRALRLHQWAKNGLVFLPLMLAGHLSDWAGWAACAGAFAAISLAASATYLINDLLDLDADRQHWSKRSRPFASGAIGIPHAIAGAAGLLTGSLALAAASGGIPVLGTILLYCAVTLAYSLHLKRIPVLDVVVLAALFTMRLGAGAVAAQVRLSSWLAVFSMFLFLSLALAKRSTEINRKSAAGATVTHGRGYVSADATLVASLGISSAMGAVLLMVLYLINEAFVDALYRFPQLLWASPVLIGLWLGRVWLLCGRGSLNDDPVAFAVTDRTSVWLGAGVLASFVGAAFIA
jgi:4-hydroxybenzoate polyprenyltransferase/phosphoserine phosphatase